MNAENRPYRIVYCTPALYMAGGVERVLTLKANYFAEHFGYDITIILTDGKGKAPFYPLSDRIRVVNLDIDFEALWTCSFLKKIFVYLRKQGRFRKALTEELMRIRPDITISLLRREINFITSIKDGSLKMGELHVNRANYRNFEANDTNLLKQLFARFWMRSLVRSLSRLDQFVVLTEEDRRQWTELPRVEVIPDPLSFQPDAVSPLSARRVIAVGRYAYQKGFDLLLRAWAQVERRVPEWQLVVYGQGDRRPYEQLRDELGIEPERCRLNGPVSNIMREYQQSSIFVFCSRFEGFGMVLVEAMACGLPVVSFDCPCGPKDIVTHDADGYLVPTGDVEALASRLATLMQRPDDIRRLAAGAVEKAQNYSLDRLALRWRQLFDSLMQRR